MALFGLAGCEMVSGTIADGLSRIGVPADATGQGIRTLSLLGGDVRVRGPEGYCIDQSASSATRGFAALAGCAVLSGEAVVMPNLDGLILVQFGAPETASVAGNEEDFAAFLQSDAGRGILAGDANTSSVEEVTTVVDRGGVLARFEDTSGSVFAGTSGPQWRGFLDIGNRLTTVSVLSFDNRPLGRAAGERLLVVAMAQLAEANAERVASAQTVDEDG